MMWELLLPIYLYPEKSGVNANGIKIFIDTYYERKCIEINLIKEAAIIWLKNTLNNPKLDEATKEGLKNKIKVLSEIL